MASLRIAASRFRRVYDPSLGESEPWYINDHCFVRERGGGSPGRWHLFGITHAEPAAPLDETFLAHAVGVGDDPLTAAWHKQPAVLPVDRSRGETHIWAPHVVCFDDRYWMVYCAGGEDHTRYRIHLASSADLWEWKRHGANPLVVDGFDARDPMLFRDEPRARWLMYYTATRPPGAAGGHHVVAATASVDLLNWSDPEVVFVHPRRGTFGGPTESPFVFEHAGVYLLSLSVDDPPHTTAIYASDDLLSWRHEDLVGELPAHAAEIITLEDGRRRVSHCGWGAGGVYLAELMVAGD